MYIYCTQSLSYCYHFSESNNDEDTHKNLMKHESFMAKSLSSIPSEIHSKYELPIKRNENELVLKQTIHYNEKPQIKGNL